MGYCLCGDTQCPSCGPAQGNWRCPICRAWADGGCIHISQRTGKMKKKCLPEVTKRAKIELSEMMEQRIKDEEYDWGPEPYIRRPS